MNSHRFNADGPVAGGQGAGDPEVRSSGPASLGSAVPTGSEGTARKGGVRDSSGVRQVPRTAVFRFQATKVVVVRPRPAEEKVVHVLRTRTHIVAPPGLRARILVRLRGYEVRGSEPNGLGHE